MRNDYQDRSQLPSSFARRKLLSVSALVSIAHGDFLGIFSAKLRYINEKLLRAIKDPFPGLWLDYSETQGKLNQMRVAKPGEQTNVCLAQEGVSEAKGKKLFC